MSSNDNERDHLDEALSSHYLALRAPLPQQREAILNRFSEAHAMEGRTLALPRRRWRAPIAGLATAAGLAAVAIGGALLITSSQRTVYGIEAVPRRLAEVNTIRQSGNHFIYDDRHPERPPIRVPFEYVIERPGKFRTTTYGVSFGKHDPPLVRTFTRIFDGSKETWIADQDKLITTSELNELDGWLKTEFFAQMFMEGLFGPPELSYRLVGHDTVRGKVCDIYEGRSLRSDKKSGDDSPEREQVVRIWIDPTLGYPLRSEREEVGVDDTIRRLEECAEISIDAPIDAATFRVEAPEGFKHVSLPRPADAAPLDPHYTAASYGGDSKLEMWHALRISDHAALVVWRRSTPPGGTAAKADWLANVTFGMVGDRQHALKHTWIYESRSPDVWNWSILQVDDIPLLERGGLDLVFTADRFTARQQFTPLRFPDARLEQLIKAAAESTLPVDAPRFSLEKLRQAAETGSAR